MTMLFSAPFMAKTRDQCPVCDGMARLALVEPHPSRIGMEIHTFTCPTCGPVKSKIVEIPRKEVPLQVAAA
jgi:hypothetical protein